MLREASLKAGEILFSIIKSLKICLKVIFTFNKFPFKYVEIIGMESLEGEIIFPISVKKYASEVPLDRSRQQIQHSRTPQFLHLVYL